VLARAAYGAKLRRWPSREVKARFELRGTL